MESIENQIKIYKLNDSFDLYLISHLNSYKKLKKLYGCKKNLTSNSILKRIFSFDIFLLFIFNFVFISYLLKFFYHYYTENDTLSVSFELYRFYSYLVTIWLKYNKFEVITQEECALPIPEFLNSITRPLVDCNMCMGLNEIPSVDFISKETFRSKYAYTAVPLLVKNSASNWSATRVFDFEFLKNLYLKKQKIKCGKNCFKKLKKTKKASFSDIWSKKSTAYEHYNENIEDELDTCQFFGYKTKFKSLNEVFNMNIDNLIIGSKGFTPWYIGW